MRTIDILIFALVALSIFMTAITYFEITDLRATVTRIQLGAR